MPNALSDSTIDLVKKTVPALERVRHRAVVAGEPRLHNPRQRPEVPTRASQRPELAGRPSDPADAARVRCIGAPVLNRVGLVHNTL